jgi:hypothetical protein
MQFSAPKQLPHVVHSKLSTKTSEESHLLDAAIPLPIYPYQSQLPFIANSVAANHPQFLTACELFSICCFTTFNVILLISPIPLKHLNGAQTVARSFELNL